MMSTAVEDSLPEACWDLLDYKIFEDAACSDYLWATNGAGTDIDVSPIDVVSAEEKCKRKREQNDSCSRAASKSCREKLRREKLNDRFLDLSSILEPGRPVKSDKSAILIDAIRVLHQLRTEAQELIQKNEKLEDHIKDLKAEKSELRKQKLQLKTKKEKLVQHLESMPPPPPPGFLPHHLKMTTFSNYGGYPMFQWIPSAVLDTSQDHVLRPPVA